MKENEIEWEMGRLPWREALGFCVKILLASLLKKEITIIIRGAKLQIKEP